MVMGIWRSPDLDAGEDCDETESDRLESTNRGKMMDINQLWIYELKSTCLFEHHKFIWNIKWHL